jgi:hypothetical protein
MNRLPIRACSSYSFGTTLAAATIYDGAAAVALKSFRSGGVFTCGSNLNKNAKRRVARSAFALKSYEDPKIPDSKFNR